MLDFILNQSKRFLKHHHLSVFINSFSTEASVTVSIPELKALQEADRVRKKSPFRKHFIEKLFLNEIQQTILEYPQLDSLKELKSIQQHREKASNLLLAHSNSSEIAVLGTEPEKILKHIIDLGFCGFKVSVEDGGFGYQNCEFAYMQEALGTNLSFLKTISENENFGVDLLNCFGSESQKEKYLHGMSSGKIRGCFAHLELDNYTPLDSSTLSTKAVLEGDGNKYIVSGTKSWVYNASLSDVIIFSANIISSSSLEEQKKIVFFIVDKNLKGITIHEPIKPIGLEGVKVSTITFDNVVISHDCILGEINEGKGILKKVFSSRELNNSVHSISMMKTLLNAALKHCTHAKHFKKFKCNVDNYNIKIGHIVATIYNVESMAYMVAGRMDAFDDADLFLESLILKIFSSESLQYVINETLEIIGNDLIVDSHLQKIIKDCQFFYASDYTNNYLKFVLSSAGLKYFINNEKSLNPIPKLRSYLNAYKVVTEKFTLNQMNKTAGFVHPVYKKESCFLDDMVIRLHVCTRILYKTFGKNVLNRKTELINLADLVVHIYSVIASLGRASRAYCLGIRNYELERKIVECEIWKHHVRFIDTDNLIRNRLFCNNFEKIFSKNMVDCFKKNFHPTRVVKSGLKNEG